ncbi:hypothetical protein BGZ95_001850 [Linnemannia exigua]|uniref:Uncharacterized protein n=1 Tax=Linnemannia exigua TaxID=604196 RepID=A0AAD4H3S0_9FUNG|nr:hypothetical protein BGZ95_001850 [Linnemannia exigua]
MNEEQQERPAVPITRVRVECEINMNNGGNTHNRFLAVLDDDLPMRDVLKVLSKQYNSYYRKSSGLCIIEQAKDESGGRLPRVGRVGDTLKHNDFLCLRGRQLLPEVVEAAAISWLFHSSVPAAYHEMTPATCAAIAEALLPTLVPSLVPALVSALGPVLAPALSQNVAVIRGAPRPHRHRLPHDNQDTDSETTTMNDDINRDDVLSANDDDIEQDISSPSPESGSSSLVSKDDEPPAVVVERAARVVTVCEDNSSDSDCSDNDEDTEAHKETVGRKETGFKDTVGFRVDAAQTAKAHDNALMNLYKSASLMDEDTDSSDEDTDSSDEDENLSPAKDVTHSSSLIVAQAAPAIDVLMAPKVVQVKSMETPAKVAVSKPMYSNGLDSLVLAQTASASSASTSPVSSRSPSPTSVRSPAPSPAPMSRRESMSLFTAPAVTSSTPPSASKTPAVPTRTATSPVMSRILISTAKKPSTGSDQSRSLVSSERSTKSKAFVGFAIVVPQDPFRPYSPGTEKEYDESESDEDEDDINSSQDFLYSAMSRPNPARAFSPVIKNEGDEEEGMLQEVYRFPAAQLKREIQDEEVKEQVNVEYRVESIITSELPCQVSLVDIKEEPLSQKFVTAIAKHRDSEDTPATSLLDRLHNKTPQTLEVLDNKEDDEEEEGPLSPEISPPGALLEYLNRPASSSHQTIGQIPGSSGVGNHPLLSTNPVQVTSSSGSVFNMLVYPTFADHAKNQGPDKATDCSVDTTEIEAFLQKDMGGLSRDKSLTSAPFFLPRIDSVPAAVKAESLSPHPVSSVFGPGRDFGDERTISPELLPSAIPMVIPRTEECLQGIDELKFGSNSNHNNKHYHGTSDDEDSIFNIPSAQPSVLGSEAMAKIPDGPYSQDDIRDAMDEHYSSSSDYSDDDNEPADSSLKRKSLTSSSDQELKRQRIVSSPSSEDDSDDSDDSDGDEAAGKGVLAVQPHPLDALDDLPLFANQSSLPSMPTLTSLSQERSVKTKKMGSLELALQQQQVDDNDEDDSITTWRTGLTTVANRSARGSWLRGGSMRAAAARGVGSSVRGRGGHGGRGGVTIAGAGRRAGSVKPSGGLEDLFA